MKNIKRLEMLVEKTIVKLNNKYSKDELRRGVLGLIYLRYCKADNILKCNRDEVYKLTLLVGGVKAYVDIRKEREGDIVEMMGECEDIIEELNIEISETEKAELKNTVVDELKTVMDQSQVNREM